MTRLTASEIMIILWLSAAATATAQVAPSLTASARSVVLVQGAYTGTGFIWDYSQGNAHQHVVTALHVVAGKDTCTVITPHNLESYTAEVTKRLRGADLALLRVKELPGDLPAVELAASPGDSVTVIGFPINLPYATDDSYRVRKLGNGTLEGVVPSTLRDTIANVPILDLDVPIVNLAGRLRKGHSGAPLFNEQGKVVGVANGYVADNAGRPTSYSWAIAASQIELLPKSEDRDVDQQSISPLISLTAVEAIRKLEIPASGMGGKAGESVFFGFAIRTIGKNLLSSAPLRSSAGAALALVGGTLESAAFEVFRDLDERPDFKLVLPKDTELDLGNDSTGQIKLFVSIQRLGDPSNTPVTVRRNPRMAGGSPKTTVIGHLSQQRNIRSYQENWNQFTLSGDNTPATFNITYYGEFSGQGPNRKSENIAYCYSWRRKGILVAIAVDTNPFATSTRGALKKRWDETRAALLLTAISGN